MMLDYTNRRNKLPRWLRWWWVNARMYARELMDFCYPPANPK